LTVTERASFVLVRRPSTRVALIWMLLGLAPLVVAALFPELDWGVFATYLAAFALGAALALSLVLHGARSARGLRVVDDERRRR